MTHDKYYGIKYDEGKFLRIYIMFFKKWFRKPSVKAVEYEPSTHQFDVRKVDKNAVKVLKQLSQSGFDAYVVGGSIRDQLMNIHSKDCDVVTNAKPEKVARLIKKSIVVGRRFRIAHARFGRDIIEIATYRSSAQSKKRKVSSQGIIKRDNIYGTIDEDVMRRDFTINALYFRYIDGHILDFVGGMDDLINKRLVSIGDPETRFPEDPVRMMRAFRFAAKLSLSIEDNILAAVDHHKNLLREISGQRLFAELIKLYYSGHASASNQLLIEHKVLEVLIPELSQMKSKDSATMLWQVMADSADIRFKQGKKLSVVYLFACLYWPLFMSQLAKKRMRHFSIQIANQVLQNAIFEIPARIKEDILEIWALQLQFKGKEKSSQKVLRSKRLRAGYELLCQRATVDPRLADLALYWSEFIHE